MAPQDSLAATCDLCFGCVGMGIAGTLSRDVATKAWRRARRWCACGAARLGQGGRALVLADYNAYMVVLGGVMPYIVITKLRSPGQKNIRIILRSAGGDRYIIHIDARTYAYTPRTNMIHLRPYYQLLVAHTILK